MKNSRELASIPVIGLTGGICSGKTTVAELFKKNGFKKISADRIVHSILDTGEIQKKLLAIFGYAILNEDGTTDRRALADLAFQDRETLSKLNSAVHPKVIDIIKKQIHHSTDPVVVDAPLLMETGLDKSLCNITIFIERPLSERLNAASKQREWLSEELKRREQMQIPLEAKQEKADMVIKNNGTLHDLEKEVKAIIKEIFLMLNDEAYRIEL